MKSYYSDEIDEMSEQPCTQCDWLRLNAEISNAILAAMTRLNDTLDELQRDIEETSLTKVLEHLQQIRVNTAPD